MKRIDIKDASVVSFVVGHRNASDAQVEFILKKAKPSNRGAFKTARKASTGQTIRAKRLGAKTGRLAKTIKDFAW